MTTVDMKPISGHDGMANLCKPITAYDVQVRYNKYIYIYTCIYMYIWVDVNVFLLHTFLYCTILCTFSPLTGKYNVDPHDLSISGFSSGGGMAMQMHVSHSALFKGTAIFAGSKSSRDVYNLIRPIQRNSYIHWK